MFTVEELTKANLVAPEQPFALWFYNDGEVTEGYRGVKKLDGDDPIDDKSNFRVASVTKQFVAHGIMKLIAEGKLSYETTMAEIFDDAPEYLRGITVMDLLNHQSGIRDYEGTDKHADRQLHDPDAIEFLWEQTDGMTKPGETYHYSNSGFILLGHIISTISGQPLEDYIRENILLPFGMTDSYLMHSGKTVIPRRVYGTEWDGEKIVQNDQSHWSGTMGDGGLYTSVTDLKKYLEKFVQMDLDTIYSPTFEEDVPGPRYAKGMNVLDAGGHKFYYHCGDTCGTKTIVGAIPDMNIRFIFTTNMNNQVADPFVDNLRGLLKI